MSAQRAKDDRSLASTPSTRTSIVARFGFSSRSVSQIGWIAASSSRAEPCGKKLASS